MRPTQLLEIESRDFELVDYIYNRINWIDIKPVHRIRYKKLALRIISELRG